MKAVDRLPDCYKEFYSVNLQKDKKIALLINGIALAIGILMFITMNCFVPISTLFSMELGIAAYAIRMLSIAVLSGLYIVLHELVHGISMKLCGTKKVKYGFTGMYAFAGSDDYYGKKSYIFIALAPVVLWGIVLAVINFLVPNEWVWVIYFLQMFNITGAAGDFYVTVKFLRFPEDILIKDCGVSIVVYSEKR